MTRLTRKGFLGRIVTAAGVASLALASVLASIALDHNPQGEYCRYGVTQEEANWHSNGQACALTLDFWNLFMVHGALTLPICLGFFWLLATCLTRVNHPTDM